MRDNYFVKTGKEESETMPALNMTLKVKCAVDICSTNIQKTNNVNNILYTNTDS